MLSEEIDQQSQNSERMQSDKLYASDYNFGANETKLNAMCKRIVDLGEFKSMSTHALGLRTIRTNLTT